MIFWRRGRKALTGGWRAWIKGVIDPQHAVRSESVAPAEFDAKRETIHFLPEDRKLYFAYEDRTILFPNTRRNIQL